MIDCSFIKIAPAEDTHREFTYRVKKEAYGSYITQFWGWDEAIQQDFHNREWQEHRPSIILYKGQPVGTFTVVEKGEELELERFYIMPQYHSQGIGTCVLKSIMEKANMLGKTIKLMVLTNNPAISLYLKNGFSTVREDNLFYFMERKPQ